MSLSCTSPGDCENYPGHMCVQGNCTCPQNFTSASNPTDGCVAAQCSFKHPGGYCTGFAERCFNGVCTTSVCESYESAGCFTCNPRSDWGSNDCGQEDDVKSAFNHCMVEAAQTYRGDARNMRLAECNCIDSRVSHYTAPYGNLTTCTDANSVLQNMANLANNLQCKTVRSGTSFVSKALDSEALGGDPTAPCSSTNQQGICPKNTYCLPDPGDPSNYSCQDAPSCTDNDDCTWGTCCDTKSNLCLPRACTSACPQGFCAPGSLCVFGGHCYHTDCSSKNPDGLCPPYQTCVDGNCAYTCETLNYSCGPLPSPNGGVTSCGTCPDGFVCDTTSMAHHCVPNNQKCDASKGMCGTASQGCSPCPPGYVCGGEDGAWPRYCIPNTPIKYSQTKLMETLTNGNAMTCPDYLAFGDSMATKVNECFINRLAIPLSSSSSTFSVQAKTPHSLIVRLDKKVEGKTPVHVQTLGGGRLLVHPTHLGHQDSLTIPIHSVEAFEHPIELVEGGETSKINLDSAQVGTTASPHDLIVGDSIVQGIATAMPVALREKGTAIYMPPSGDGNIPNQTSLQVLFADDNVRHYMSPSVCGVSPKVPCQGTGNYYDEPTCGGNCTTPSKYFSDTGYFCDAATSTCTPCSDNTTNDFCSQFGGGIPCQPGTVPILVSGNGPETGWYKTPSALTKEGAPPNFSLWSCGQTQSCPDGWEWGGAVGSDNKFHWGCKRVPLPGAVRMCRYNTGSAGCDRESCQDDAAWKELNMYNNNHCGTHGSDLTSCSRAYVQDNWPGDIPHGFIYPAYDSSGKDGWHYKPCLKQSGCPKSDMVRCWTGNDDDSVVTWSALPNDSSRCTLTHKT